MVAVTNQPFRTVCVNRNQAIVAEFPYCYSDDNDGDGVADGGAGGVWAAGGWVMVGV